jgi:hypothetical protein
LIWIVRHHDAVFGDVFHVQPQIALTLVLIRPMTMQTVLGKNRADLIIESHLSRRTAIASTARQHSGDAKQRPEI